MITAAGTSALGTPVAFLGLSGENVTRLVAGEPIRVSAARMQRLGLPPMEVVIHYGRTEEAIRDDLRSAGATLKDAGDAT